MRVAGASRAAFAATWRDERDQVVGTTWGGTMCWFPRKPWRLRIARGDFEHVIRCRECPGCLEFERRRLADRLHAKYSSQIVRARPLPEPSLHNISVPNRKERETLWLVRIYAPLERHAAICHALHRRPRLQLEPGMYRLGTTSFGLLARSPTEIQRALKRLRLEHRVESIRLSRRRRAWRAITAGIAVARAAYGEQVKRWYVKGLPPAEKESWDVVKMPKGSHYQRTSSPRAWSRANLVLVPPELWRMRRCDRRSLLATMAKASSPEAAAFVTSVVSSLAQARRMQSPVIASSKPRPSREAMMRQFEHVARVADVARASEPPHDLTSSPLGGEGYTSSEHSQGELLPEKVSIEGRRPLTAAEVELLKGHVEHAPQTEHEWKEKRLERERRLLAEQLERLRKKIMGGE